MSTNKKQEIIDRALNDLEFFIRLVHPTRVLGAVHSDLISWMTRSDAKTHQLILLPRDHQKSAIAAYYVAWMITKNPAIRILYISATSNLASKQLKFIKDILTCDAYQFYWPEMVNKDESKREKWTESEISVDHPIRRREFIRDPTVFTAGLTTTIVGLHCDLSILDDVVVDDNAYSSEGREKVRAQASYLASIAGAESKQLVVGTRYHPKDLYNDFLETVVQLLDEETGETKESYSLYEVYERQVESRGDGTGEFLWPRQQGKNGKWYGFNQQILAQKKAQYFDQAKFRSQYYNDPTSSNESPIKAEYFQYYRREAVRQIGGDWYYGDSRLNVFAAMDFAYSTSKTADYTAIVIVGIDNYSNYYVLDIDRFKTDNIKEYFDRLMSLYSKWGFRKIRCEVTAAQTVIVKDLKENYIRAYNLPLSIDEYRPVRGKADRILATLQPKYANLQVWHYKGGNCSLLEEELVQVKPTHDDIKDCLAACIDLCIPPLSRKLSNNGTTNKKAFHSRFGGTI